MSDDLAARIERLEMHIAHQDQTIEDLNSVVLDQRDELSRLTRRIDKMHGRMADLEDHMPAPEANKPPHW